MGSEGDTVRFKQRCSLVRLSFGSLPYRKHPISVRIQVLCMQMVIFKSLYNKKDFYVLLYLYVEYCPLLQAKGLVPSVVVLEGARRGCETNRRVKLLGHNL